MNKKVNTILFVVGATLFIVAISVLCFTALTLLYHNYLIVHISEEIRAWGFALIFIISIVISVLIYRVVLKFIMTRINTDKYFNPLFAGNYEKN